MDFSNFTFRCSSLGYIATEPRGKTNLEIYQDAWQKKENLKQKLLHWQAEYDAIGNKMTKTAGKKLDTIEKNYEKFMHLTDVILPELEKNKDRILLSSTCKAHLFNVWIEARYGRVKELKTKYIKKGNMMEEDAITLYSIVTNKYFEKNQVRDKNEWIEGEFDFCECFGVERTDEDIVVDTKVSWDIFTFYANLSTEIKKLYEWQLFGYMWIFGFRKARLVYALLNTPTKLIRMEQNRKFLEFIGSEDEWEEEKAEIEKNMVYDDIVPEERLIEFDVEWEEDKIEKIKPIIEECRRFLDEIENNPAIMKNKLKTKQ